MVVREGERLDNAVPDFSGIGRSVVFQDYLLLLFHGVSKGLDASSIGLGALEFIDAREVINGSKLLVQGGFQGMGAVKVLNEVAKNLCFLVGEVDQL